MAFTSFVSESRGENRLTPKTSEPNGFDRGDWAGPLPCNPPWELFDYPVFTPLGRGLPPPPREQTPSPPYLTTPLVVSNHLMF